MNYTFKNAFSGELVRALETTGLGRVISVRETNGHDILTVDIGPLEIPQYPVVLVNRIERVEIVSDDDDLPIAYCREDFPVVPHLNILSDNRKTLCLFDLSYEDVKYMFNANVFLQRIVFWFQQTARGKLHQPNQPLEPFFPGARDGLILRIDNDYPFVRLKQINTPYGFLYKEIPLHDRVNGQVYSIIGIKIKKVFSENIINKMPKTLSDLDDAFGESILAKLEAYIHQFWRIRQTRLYADVFQQKETELRSSPVILVLHISLSRTKNGEPEQYQLKAFKIAKSFQVLFQAFGYKQVKNELVKDPKQDQHEGIPVIPYEVLWSYDRLTAYLFNERSQRQKNDSFVQIGLGALGSQVANNCIRSGYGKWTYIDLDVLYPHNLARHCLSQDYIGQNKAQAMQVYANSLTGTHDPSVINAIPRGVFDNQALGDITSAIESSKLIVDCSASIAVGRYLSHELAGNTRSVSFFMNPSGTALVMLLEDANRSIRLDTLEMQYYRMLNRTPELYGHLKSEYLALYSSTCRGTSLVYPQDNTAIFSGLCSKAIKEMETNDDAAISIWSLNGLSLLRHEEEGECFDEVCCQDWSVKVSTSLTEKLYSQRQVKMPNETGGVLIGTFDFAHHICYIVDSIDSPPDSQEYPSSYIRGSNGLQSSITEIEDITIGNLCYVGEWHSHPTMSTEPSHDDGILLRAISDYAYIRGNPGVMVIVGDQNYSIFIKMSGGTCK